MRVVADWLAAHPSAHLLDVGSSVGVYSLLALAISPHSHAWAFDADLVSLKSTRLICRHAGADRLHLIHGFVSACNEAGLAAGAAAAQTAVMLDRAEISDDPELCRYTCIDNQEHAGIPTHSLDGLFLSEPGMVGPILLKVDVEGAEMLVLRGAAGLLKQLRPTLLVSVHPETLGGFGFEKADVAALLAQAGYTVRILGIDHEEHWWCDPIGN
jgi:FkbM family methyltransferase